MADAKYEARLAVLAGWAREAAGMGHTVPSDEDLEKISLLKDAKTQEVDRSTVEPWLPTIQWLLKQAAFGVAEPHRQLPVELGHPLGFTGFAAEPAPAAAVPEAEEKAPEEPAAPVPAAAEVSLVEVAPAQTGEPEGTVTVVTKIKPASSSSRTPKWESDAHEQVHAAVKKFAKPLRNLLDRDANEGDTRLVVTDLLCEGLGYDKFRDLTTEYMVKQDFADYGVRIDKQLVGFIEVKRISQKLNERHLRQVQMYAVNEGVEWMILTNGQVWRAYHLTGGLPVVVDLAFEVDLLGPETVEEKAEKLFYLHREALKRRRIDDLWKHRAATSPEALLDILMSDTVLDAIRKEVKRNSGISTTVQDLATVLRTEVVDRKLIAK
ncbi:type I restriction enzyme HsdR N-terminal domain-containing protein [Arthrobacter sp. zg-Y411]|uniref:type I restriction enzyme HsdR N-terminal domain-containing protein n=1 Tax=Arthrobacter TaxID=1663 RepID=UPI001D159E73|nr:MULTISPECIES: type I restriction enzyme HsdR N-terminal domain-containing protein [Arthrobacter]MCC3295830.1 type I restriction enzyme HsdR N-terminal domain-containing protein [Arthrobacter zhangbolii]MDN3905486.1 type I restriction enzyme HsdR N-terminal domain-containing protein [Arthrobacter sp. YD2]